MSLQRVEKIQLVRQPNVTHMAIDQYGNTYHDLGRHPRKALLDILNRKRAEKMYIDGANGKPIHTGWVIAGLWLTVYEVRRMGA